MNRTLRISIVAIVTVAAAAILFLKPSPEEISPALVEAAALPTLLELGADKCVPCKMMAPILEELKTEYAGRLQIEFIDVWKHPEAGKTHGVRVIPLQIFFDELGQELFRHEGFYAKEDLMAKWNELGYEFK